jgi:hypothetical protein
MLDFNKVRINAQVEAARQQQIIEEKLAQMSGKKPKPAYNNTIQIKQFVCPKCTKAVERCICNPVCVKPIICIKCSQLTENCICELVFREVHSPHDTERDKCLQVSQKAESIPKAVAVQKQAAIAKIQREVKAKSTVSSQNSDDLADMW